MRIEIRSDSVLLSGYVNAVERESRILPSPMGKFKEKIMSKTFERALLKTTNVDLLLNHRKDRKLGSTSSGELELREDNIGLFASATITDPETIEFARSGQLRGWSFGMNVVKDSWDKNHEDGIARRTIEDLNLSEVSVLANKTPAYIATSIEAREEGEVMTEVREEESDSVVTDNREKIEETTEVEQEEIPEVHDYTVKEHEILLLKAKGSL
jgi:uncharacterized protein